MDNLPFLIVAGIILILIFRNIIRIVPQNEAYIIERLGKYCGTLEAGIHLLIPFVDRVAYKHSLKEFAIDVPAQQAITKDNVALGVDGVLYLRIMGPTRGLLRCRESNICHIAAGANYHACRNWQTQPG